MKNSFTLLIVIPLVLATGLGCGLINSAGDAVSGTQPTLENRAIETAVGVEKIGIPECDEVADILNAEMQNPNDDFVSKAVKATVFNQIKQQFKTAVEQSQAANNNNADMAKVCREFKVNLEKYRAERNANQQ